MSLSLMMDIVLLAIFILIVFSCAHKGFVRTLMSLAALVAAFVLANSASVALADPITERWAAPRMETFLTEKVSEYLPEDTLDTFIDMGDRALGMIQSMLSASDEEEAEKTGVSRTEKDTVENVKDEDANSLQQVAHTLAYALVRWLLFAILLALFYAILRALVENLSFIDRIPIVGTLDALLGVVLGIAIGLVVLFIPLIVTVNILPDILGGALEVPETFYKDSIVLNVLYTVYPFK
ncbi:MAG: hypothetical protein IKM07_00320 [Clostridia bacterium]|nr:hypothetical protein [Oscillospiraceae bacterium]MBR6747351.1 hypothetical protein [Clostridia bacterium]